MADQMSPAQARVIDPVLTGVARGYEGTDFASHYLFPVVAVGQRGGKIVEFGAEAFLEYATERAPGANIQEVNYGHTGADYALIQNALAGKVPIELLEEAGAVPGIDLGRTAILNTMQAIQRGIEIKAAGIAAKAASYDSTNKLTLSGSSQWSHKDSTPAKAVETAKEAIATGIGRDPNVLVLGQPVGRALRNHPDVVDRIKHTHPGFSGAISNAMMAQYFDIEMVIEARARKGKPGDFDPIWGKVAVLAYSNVTPLAAMGSPSFGYTYRLRGYPIAEPAHYDRDTRSWKYPVVTEDTPVLAGKAGGYLFSAAVA